VVPSVAVLHITAIAPTACPEELDAVLLPGRHPTQPGLVSGYSAIPWYDESVVIRCQQKRSASWSSTAGLSSMTAASDDFSSAPVASDFPTGHDGPTIGPQVEPFGQLGTEGGGVALAGQLPRSVSSGTCGSASLLASTGLPDRTRAWIGSVTSQTLTFMPASTRPPASQNARNSRSSTLPRKTTWSFDVAGVLHAQVVLVGMKLVGVSQHGSHRARHHFSLPRT
jgi:hypothetical protein